MEKISTGKEALRPLRNTIGNNKGFTLIELIIVIIIIGILAAVAIPKYTEIQNQAADATAKGVLSALRGSNQIVYANKVLKNLTNVYTMQELLDNAQLQGVSVPNAVGNDVTITVASRTYTFNLKDVNLPTTIGVVTCTASVPVAEPPCTNW